MLLLLSSIQGAYAESDSSTKISGRYLDTVKLDTALFYISGLDLRETPELYPQAQKSIEKILQRSQAENYERMEMVIVCVSVYAFRNNQYETGFKVLEDIYQNRSDLSLRAKVILNKNRAVFYNKLGLFQRSVEILEEGLKLAEELGNSQLLLDFNEHLAHEYTYLSLVDPSYQEEVNRLNKNSYKYAMELGDSAEIFIQYFNLLEETAPLREIEKRKKTALEYFSRIPHDSTGEEQKLYSEYLLNEYLYIIFRNQEYQEYLKDAEPFLSKKWYQEDPVFLTYSAKAYLELRNTAKAREYAHKAKDAYYISEDNDRKRTALFYLPSIFGDLGEYKTAIHFAKERNNTFKNQIIVFNNLTKELNTFNTELRKEESKSKKQTAINKALILGLVVIGIIVAIIIGVSRSIRRKNKVIENTLNEVEKVNTKLNQANYDLESFAYASAHDIKNPLHTISGFVQLIKLDNKNQLSEEANQYLSHVDESIENISNLINSILKYAKVGNQKLTLQELDLNQKIEKTKLLLHQQLLDTEGTVHTDYQLPRVMASPDLMQQVILNLMSNAIKYHRPGHPPVLHISATSDTEFHYIHFRDNGIGIPKENLDKIFDLFSRAQNSGDYDGVGVGLAVCMKIIKMHGGEIIVQNNSNHGTTFTLKLPKKKSKANSKNQLSQSPELYPN